MSNTSGTGLFYHEQVGIPIRIAQTVGITVAAFLAGETAASSFITAPALLQSPAPLLAKQWKQVFGYNAAYTGPASLACTAIFGYLAAREEKGSAGLTLYTLAAVLVPAIIPYNYLVVGNINNKLIEKADNLASAEITDTAAESGVAKDETTHALVDKWATFNLGSALLSTIGAACALWASLDKIHVGSIANFTVKTGANRVN